MSRYNVSSDLAGSLFPAPTTTSASSTRQTGDYGEPIRTRRAGERGGVQPEGAGAFFGERRQDGPAMGLAKRAGWGSH